jgi:hypothetical protein
MKIDIIQRFSLPNDRSSCSVLINCGTHCDEIDKNVDEIEKSEEKNNINTESKDTKDSDDENVESNILSEPDLLIVGTESGRLMVDIR